MTSLKLSRRAALAGLGATTLGLTSPRFATASSAAPEQALLIPHGSNWSHPDFVTIGIGETGHILISGGMLNVWLGREYLATAGVESWRVPGSIATDEAYKDAPPLRGRPLTLVMGDLADRRWFEIVRQIMAEARDAGRFVVGANACFGANHLPFETLVDRLGAVCDCFILDPDLPTWIADGMDAIDQAVLIVSPIETIAAIAARHGARAIAGRMTPGIYWSDVERFDWQAGRSPLPPRLQSVSAPPTLLAFHLPPFLPRRLARAFHQARRSLSPRPAGLTATAYSPGSCHKGGSIDMVAHWLTRVA